MDVAHAQGLKVPPFGGRLDYDKLLAGDGALDNLRRHAMILLVGLKYRRLKSSSLQSLERGRPTEIDYFNGFIAQKGEELGVDCPINRRLTVMIKEIEGDKRSIKVAKSLRSCVLCAKRVRVTAQRPDRKAKRPLRKEENLPKRSFLKGYASR